MKWSKKFGVFLLIPFAFLFLMPAHADAAGFQFQSSSFGVAPAFVGSFPAFGFAAVPFGGCGVGFQPAFVGGNSFQFQQRGFGVRGFRGRRGFQLQQNGIGAFGQSLQINQQRGLFGRIRGQQIQSSGPGGSFQLNQ